MKPWEQYQSQAADQTATAETGSLKPWEQFAAAKEAGNEVPEKTYTPETFPIPLDQDSAYSLKKAKVGDTFQLGNLGVATKTDDNEFKFGGELESTPVGAFLRAAGVNAAPAVAFVAGMGQVGKLVAPLANYGVPGQAAAAALSIGGGMLGALGARTGEDYLLSPQTKAQLAVDAQKHEIASLVGGTAPNLAFFGPGLALNLENRLGLGALGAGLQGVGEQLNSPNRQLPEGAGRRMVESGAANMLLSNPTKLGAGLMGSPLEAAEAAVPKKTITSQLNVKAGEPLMAANAKANSIIVTPSEPSVIGENPNPSAIQPTAEMGNAERQAAGLEVPEPKGRTVSVNDNAAIEAEALAQERDRLDAQQKPWVQYQKQAEAPIVEDKGPVNYAGAPEQGTLGELIGQRVKYAGYEGTLIKQPDGQIAVLRDSVTKGEDPAIPVEGSGKDITTKAKDVEVSRMADQTGAINPALALHLGSGALGAALGYSQGDNSEERAKYAALGGLAGLSAPTLLSRAARINAEAVLSHPTAISPKVDTKVAAEGQMPVKGLGLAEKGNVAPAKYLGAMQIGDVPSPQDLQLYNLTADIPGHPKGSTVSDKTLLNEGFTLPKAEAPVTPISQKPKESIEDYRSRLTDGIQKKVDRALQSTTVDVDAKAQIRKELSGLNLGDTKHLDELASLRTVPELEYLHDRVRDLTSEGRAEVKTRDDALKADVAAVKEDFASGESYPWESPKPAQNAGVRQSALGRFTDKFGFGVKKAAETMKNHGRALLVRDVALDVLDGGANYNGPLSRRVGGAIDHAYNTEQNMRRDWVDPIRKIVADNKIDQTSMEKVNIYATDRMDGGRERLVASGIDPKRIDEVSSSITPAEKAYYDEVRNLFDDKLFPKVQEMMKDLYNVDLKHVENYWPYLRDFEASPLKPEEAVPVFGKGDEVGFDEAHSMRQLVNDFLPAKTTKTRQGFTIERMPEAKSAIKLSADVVDRHLKQVAHLLAFQRDMKVLGTAVRHPDFAAKYGDLGQKYTLNLLDTVTRDSDPLSATRWAMVDALQRNTSSAIIGLRLISQLKHGPNVFFSLRSLGPDFLSKGIVESAKTIKPSTAQTQFLKRNFSEIYQRYGGETAIADMIGKEWMGSQKLGVVRNATFAVERTLDAAIARATVIGAYMKELQAKGMNPNDYLTLPFDQEAGRRALIISRQSVTSPLRKDIGQFISRGQMTIASKPGNITVNRTLTQFGQTMLRQAAYAKHDIFDSLFSDKEGGRSAAATASLAMLAMLTAEVGIAEMNKAFLGIFNAEPQPKKAKTIGDEVMFEGARRIPWAGNALAAAQYGETGIPTLDTVTKGLSAGYTMQKGTNEFGRRMTVKEQNKNKADVGAFLGEATGIPGSATAAQILRNRQDRSGR